jgi:hypothetical protein
MVLFLNKSAFIQQFSQGRWRGSHYGKGMGYISPPGTRRRLRWNLKNQKSLMAMHLSLSQDTVDSVASAIPNKYGTRQNQLPDAPFLDDPVLRQLQLRRGVRHSGRSSRLLSTICLTMDRRPLTARPICEFALARIVGAGTDI